MAQESRRAQRFSLNQIANLIFSHNKKMAAKAVNISATGLLVAAEDDVDPGTMVYVTLCADLGCSEKFIHAEGIVTRCVKGLKDYMVGIDFTMIDGDEMKAIEDLGSDTAHVS